MARYTGPSTKIARKFGEPIFGPDRSFEKKNYPPGQHGLAKKRKKTSEYGIQLKEKQKVKYTYGLLERQFRNLYEKAAKMKGKTGENLICTKDSLTKSTCDTRLRANISCHFLILILLFNNIIHDDALEDGNRCEEVE
jgi:hypothetical protein